MALDVLRILRNSYPEEDRWVYVPELVVARCRKAAKERNEQKAGYASSRYWNQDSHFYGLLGEYIFGLTYNAAPDFALRVEGDGGEDFPGIDVKTSLFVSDPHIKHPVDAKHWPEFFCLVVLDQWSLSGNYKGYCSAEELRQAEARDYGHGPQYHLSVPALHRGLPCPAA